MFRGFPIDVLFSKDARRHLRLLKERTVRKPVTTPWGFQFIGPDFLVSGDFESEETSLVRDALREVDILVNVGAHMGFYCCHALEMGKRVIAVEPNPDNLFYLLRNIKMNGWSEKVEVFATAVGSHPGISDIWGSGTATSLVRGWAGNDSFSSLAPLITLDRIAAEAIEGQRALFVVDVEGYELFVLQGARRCLKSTPRPLWLVEITTTQNRPMNEAFNPYLIETFSEFFDRGYECTTADSKTEKIEIAKIQSVLNGERLDSHNFFFK